MGSVAEIILLAYAVFSTADAPRADTAALRELGVPTAGRALVAWLQPRLPADGDAEVAAALVGHLGDRRFPIRDKATSNLIAMGPKVAPALRRAAETDPSAEVRNRARTALKAIATLDDAWPHVVLRLLEERPAGALAAILGLLPLADEDTADVAVIALGRLGRQGGRIDPAIVAALADREPTRRAAAAVVIGQSRRPEAASQLRLLLTDADPTVRLNAALGLLLCGDRTAAGVLVELLETPAVAERAEAALAALAGDRALAVNPKMPSGERRRAWAGHLRDHAAELNPAAVQELLPGSDVARRARKSAELFIAFWQRSSGSGQLSVSSAPFWSAGQVLQTRADMERAWGNTAGGTGAYHFRFHRLLSPAKALAYCQGEGEISHIKNLGPAEHRVMVYSPTPNSWGLIVIRVRAGRVTVAGLSVDRGGDPPVK